MGVIRQTEEKDELPALWRNVEMIEDTCINKLLVSNTLLIVCVIATIYIYSHLLFWLPYPISLKVKLS